jgi:DsbC/DsbD-like thiol-disulfide interchange protein
MRITENFLARYRSSCHLNDMIKHLPAPAASLNRRQILLGSAALSCVALPVGAQVTSLKPSASPWANASHSGMRLLANGNPVKSGLYQAGIELRMNPGFKTYWRHPGDSGVPPTFNFEGSQNLASAEVLYPAPAKFADGAGGYSFGYAAPEVMFPVLVTAVDPEKPVQLRLKADYAVCETICIPVHGEASLVVAETIDRSHTNILASVHASLPQRVAIGQGQALKILKLQKAAMPEQFSVDVQMPADSNAELFLEGESPWFFETKSFTRQSTDRGSFLVHVIERSKAADCTGAEVTLTLVAEKYSIEVATRLDLAMVTH